MIDPTTLDLNQLPKKFCDGAIGGHGKDVFTFAITSGTALDTYATTPQIMKSIAGWMMSQIATYEKQYGEIDMTPAQIQSPIQVSDL